MLIMYRVQISLSKKILLNINGFSNDYFMYSEDVDLQKRLFDKKHYSYLIKGPLDYTFRR